MDLLVTFLLVLISVATGVLGTLAIQWYVFNVWMMRKPYVGPPDKPMSSQCRLPQDLIDALKSSEVPKKESCFALNLLFQFLFKELRNTEKVRNWFRKKLSLEFEELLMRTTTGKLFDKIRIRDLHLGKQFPAIKSISVKDIVIDPEHQHIDNLDLCLDLEYTGGFQLSIDANMLLGKAAFLSVKVNHISGQGRLQFTRHPYTHWSFTFYNEPTLDLQVESQFQGRHLSQVTSLIISQIRRALKKKHTLPGYKLRYKPFFDKSEPGEEDSASQLVSPGTLEITIVEITRLMETLASGDVYCSLAIDSTAWVEMVQSETASFMTLDLIVAKPTSQQLGIVFKQEFVAERYAACVVVETVLPQSPAATADVRRGDILLAVEGKKVTSMSHVARLIKGVGDRFVLRIERKSNYKFQHVETDDKDITVEKDSDMTDTTSELKIDASEGIRHRHGSIGEKTESESSNSNPASLSGSPAKTQLNSPRSNQSSPERMLRANFHRNSSTSVDGEDDFDYLQIHKTKKLAANQILPFNEALTFQLQPKHRYLNVSVWSKAQTVETDGGKKVRAERDKLVGHVSVPLGAVAAQCNASRMGHYLKSYTLLPPDSQTDNDINRSHRLWGHSGFEPCLCYGDILLSFLYLNSGNQPTTPACTPGDTVPITVLIQPLPTIGGDSTESTKQHDFIRTHFNRTTQCEFCGKKIWLKDAVQCRDCAMTCHKKCVSKCQLGTICMPGSMQRRLSVPPDDSSTENSPRRKSVHPEIITTCAADDGTVTPQGRRGIGSLIASVTHAAQSRGLKRAGSANNLALPSSADSLGQSRSLPPSPQHSPACSRKTSLVGHPFQFAHTVELEGEAADEMTTVLNHLLRHPNDEDIMSVAKNTGKDLYSSLPLVERKEKINGMITKLKSAMDVETMSRMSLSREEQGSKDAVKRAKLAFLIGKSDEKVQALAVLMLHFCSGLQFIQDQEDMLIRQADLGLLDDESMTIELT